MVRRVVYDESIEKLLKEHYTISESLPFVIVSDSRSHFVLNVYVLILYLKWLT